MNLTAVSILSCCRRGESIGSSVSSNSLSGRMVLHFFYVIAVIVADRLAYFMRLLWLKAVAHIVAVVYVHVLVFVNIPKDTNVDFEDNPPLIGFYLVFAVYALLSSAQLVRLRCICVCVGVCVPVS